MRRRSHPFTRAIVLSTLTLCAGCAASGEEAEEVASSEDELGLFPHYSGYLVTRDFDSDGDFDVMTLSLLGSNVAVRLNKGDGTFGPVKRYAVGIQPTYIATADFNGDGILDVAVINATTSNVSILLGIGDGTFHPAVNYSILDPLGGQVAAAPFGVVTGDFNHDGNIDIATSNVGTNNISVLLGDGDGSFQLGGTYSLLTPISVGLVPFPLLAEDFDHDGHLDLMSGGAAHVIVLKGHGDGTFTVVNTHNTGIAITCIEAADFNQDSITDVVVTALGSSTYFVLKGNADGTFTQSGPTWSGGIAAQCFGIGDLNGDNLLDISIANTATLLGVGNVAVHLGNGDGTFDLSGSYPLGLTPWAASTVDMDGDGKNDVAACNGGNSTMSVLFGNGDGTLDPQVVYPM